MKKFFIGVGWGLALDIAFPLGVRSVEVYLGRRIIDIELLLDISFLMILLLGIYSMFLKKDYKTTLGVVAAFVFGFIIWTILLAGV